MQPVGFYIYKVENNGGEVLLLGLQRGGTFLVNFRKLSKNSPKDSKKFCKVSKISRIYPKLTENVLPFYNPNDILKVCMKECGWSVSIKIFVYVIIHTDIPAPNSHYWLSRVPEPSEQ